MPLLCCSFICPLAPQLRGYIFFSVSQNSPVVPLMHQKKKKNRIELPRMIPCLYVFSILYLPIPTWPILWVRLSPEVLLAALLRFSFGFLEFILCLSIPVPFVSTTYLFIWENHKRKVIGCIWKRHTLVLWKYWLRDSHFVPWRGSLLQSQLNVFQKCRKLCEMISSVDKDWLEVGGIKESLWYDVLL